MRPASYRLLPALLLASAGAMTGAAQADDLEAPNFEDHIDEILSDACASCHRGSRARNGLKLTSLAKLLEGGSSGPAIVPGDADGSLMLQLMNHEHEPFMPEDEDKLELATLTMMREWINAGAPATATSGPSAGVVAPSTGPAMNLAAVSAVEATAAVPIGLSSAPLWWSPAGDAVMALAPSPSALLVAVGGHKQVSLHNPENGEVLGVLAFPEGEIKSLRFSRNGALLIAAGGRGGESGRVVGWDVETGERVFEMGDEPDVLLAADLSGDHSLLAYGGIDGVLRVHATETGEELYTSEKHTDWITAVVFSNDGVLLASADRAGGLFVWEALSGREFHKLEGQKAAVNALAWRADSMLLATGADNGDLRLFEMQAGKRVKGWSSHGGVLALDFLPDGTLLSGGRDARARLWDGNGKELSRYDGAEQLAVSCGATFDGKLLLVGDMAGVVRVYAAGQKAAQRSLLANPQTALEAEAIAARVALAEAEKIHANLAERKLTSDKELTSARAQLDGLNSKSSQLEVQLASALALQVSLSEAAAEAEAQELPAQASLSRARELHETLTADLAKATQAADQRREASQAAASQQVAAQRALQVAADEAQRAAAELALTEANARLEGALALAQLATTEASRLTLRETSARLQRDLWQSITTPLETRRKESVEAKRVADESALALDLEATQARDVIQPAIKRLAELAASAAELDPQVTAAITRREESRAVLTAAESAWDHLRTLIDAAGGQVPR